MEESVLRQYSSKLNTLLRTSDTTRNAFSNSLFSDSLLSKDAKHMIETKDGMSAANVLMTELQLKVQNCPSKLQPVIDLMKREIQLEDIAKQMHMELLKHKGEVCEDSMPRPDDDILERNLLSCTAVDNKTLTSNSPQKENMKKLEAIDGSASPMATPLQSGLPPCEADLMYIASYGDKYSPHIEVARKISQRDKADALEEECEEKDYICDMFREDSMWSLPYCYTDFPGYQLEKSYYIKRISKFFACCKKEGAAIFYTGNSQEGTGNWCFKDGIITFQEIFKLYMEYFRGKRLSLICDCSHSGNWVYQCAKVLDECNIPPCGHHTTKQRILINVYASCRANQKATMLAYTRKGLRLKKNNTIAWTSGAVKLSPGQTTACGDFRAIYCQNNSEECQINSSFKWSDRFIDTNRIYLILGQKDPSGCPFWQYILIKEDKVDLLKSLTNTHHLSMIGNWLDFINESDIILHGKGDSPSPSIIAEKNLQYGDTISKLYIPM